MALKKTPIEIIAQAAPALSPVEACFVSRALAADKIKDAIDAMVPDNTEATVDVTVRFTGKLARGEAGERKATSRALRKATLALLVRRMGLQRDAALALLTDVLTEAANMGEDAEKALLEECPEIEGAFGAVDKLADALPKIVTSGRVTLSSVKVERV